MSNEINSKLIAAPRPILQRPEKSTGFLGRVVIEVWEKSDRVFFSAPLPTSLKDLALQALHRPDQATMLDQTELTTWHAPLFGPPFHEAFIGNAIFDIWNDRTIIGLTGPKDTLLARCVIVLSEPFSEFYLEP